MKIDMGFSFTIYKYEISSYDDDYNIYGPIKGP